MYMCLPTDKWCLLSWYPINSSMEELPVMLGVTLLICTCVGFAPLRDLLWSMTAEHSKSTNIIIDLKAACFLNQGQSPVSITYVY